MATFQTVKEKSNIKNNKDVKNNKQNLFLILIPILIVIVALSLFLGLWFGCKAKQPAPVQKSLTINENTIDEKSNYKIAAGTNIYYSNSSIKLGVDLIDLNALREDNDGITNFVVTSNIDYGFLIDTDMDCHLSGLNNAVVKCESTNEPASGIVVGKLNPNLGIYEKCMEIAPNLEFDITSTNGNSYGVFFNATSNNSIHRINANFKISASSNTAYGVYFNSTIDGNTTINGVFNISASADAYGILFNGDLPAGSTQVIDGFFNVISSNKNAFGIMSYSTAFVIDGTTIINGTFMISSTFSMAIGFYWNGNITKTITFNGVYTIKAVDDAKGIVFMSIKSNSSIEINGAFTIVSNKGTSRAIEFMMPIETNSIQKIDGTFAILSTASDVYGILYDSDFSGITTVGASFTLSAINVTRGIYFLTTNPIMGTLVMTSTNTHFYSTNVDGGNVFTKTPQGAYSYEWNENVITADGQGIADQNLFMIDINSDSGTPPHFAIQVIKTADGNAKRKFNTVYSDALSEYIKGIHCPPICIPWLSQIIQNIPLQ